MAFLIAYSSALVVYLLVEGIWLGVIAKQDYQNQLGERLRESYKVWPWLVFYLGYTAANVYFSVMPNLQANTVLPTLLNAAIFGAAGYGTYNLTCYSILKNWPLAITIKDWAWGTFATTLSGMAAWFIATAF